MNANGTGQVRLTNIAGNDREPRFSPDGNRILFASSRDGNSEVYVMNADGSNPANLTNNSANDSEPSWSPDGARIIFSSSRLGDATIFTMNADGSNQTQFFPFVGGFQFNPTYSPGGTHVAFSTFGDFNQVDIVTIDTNAANGFIRTASTTDDRSPSWTVAGPPRVTSLTKVGGQISLEGIGTESVAYAVEATDDLLLQPFQVVGPAIADVSGNFEFTDSNLSNITKRFYRVVYR